LNDNKEALGLGSLKLMLEQNRYTVKDLALAQNKIPADADVIVVAGPTQSFQDFEIAALEQYLKTGGSLLLALETMTNTGLDKLVAKFGIVLENNNIQNVVQTVGGAALDMGPAMGNIFSESNKITKIFKKDELTLFRNPQGLKTTNVGKGMVVEDLVKSGPSSVAFKTLEVKGEQPPLGTYTLVSEVSGQFPGAAEGAKPFEVIIAGDVDFLANQLLYQHLNRDLVLNSIAALAKEENLISITAKDPQTTQLIMNETKFAIFLFGFIIPLPLLLLGTSVGIWVRRRNA
jgi:ABC-type uncharacterized transport system involved in gliding motility auxiliary subunit